MKTKAFMAFCFGFLLYMAIILPEIIYHKGVFLSNGDFRTQYLPFMYHIKDAVLSGNVIWDFSSGLGAQFLSSYIYYNLFSPFTAVYLIVPRAATAYAIPYVTALKYGIGTLLAYLYSSRFLKNKNYAVIAGLLYMFSSASSYDMVYHFDDMIAFFPLMLIAMEELCINGRKGVFAVTVAFLALLNYYFFFGEAVFAVIYFLARGVFDKDFGISLKKFFNVLFEAIVGVMIVMAMLLPVVITLMHNDKATGLIPFSEMLVYNDIYIYFKIIQSAFMIPDPFYLVTLFPDLAISYPFGTIGASVASYLPLFSLTGVIAYIIKNRKSWESILLVSCGIMSFVPVLNQLFSALNSAYYARWFFMPLLICAMVTMKALEQKISFKSGIITCGSALALMIIYQLFVDTEHIVTMRSPRVYYNPLINIIHIALSLVSLILVIFAVKIKRDKEYFPKLFILSFIGIYMCYGIMTFTNLGGYEDKGMTISYYELDTEKPGELNSGERIGLPSNSENYNLIWGNSSTSFFNSINESGFSEFSSANEVEKMSIPMPDIPVKSSPELMDFLSVRYILSPDANDEAYSRYVYRSDFGNYAVMENPNYIPVGIAYDSVISYDDFIKLEKTQKHRANMKYIIAEDVSVFDDILDVVCPESEISDDEYAAAVESRKAESSYSSEYMSDGLVSRLNLAADRVVLYSMPYSDGWTAYIDGEKTDIYNVNNGLIGIKAPVGDHEITLKYTVRGFSEGIIISVFGVLILTVYMIISRKMDNMAKAQQSQTE